MAGECPNDGAAMADGERICKDCQRVLAADLGYLCDRMDDLYQVATRQAKPGPKQLAKGSIGPRATNPDPLREDAWGYYQYFRQFYTALVPAGTPRQTGRSLLLEGVPSLARNRSAPSIQRQIRQAADSVKRIFDWESEKRRGGWCQACSAILWVLDKSQYAICPQCGQLNDLAETRKTQRDWLMDSYQEGTSGEIAQLLTQCGWPVTSRAIRKWAQKGIIGSEKGADGRNVYRVGDIIARIEHDTPASAA